MSTVIHENREVETSLPGCTVRLKFHNGHLLSSSIAIAGLVSSSGVVIAPAMAVFEVDLECLGHIRDATIEALATASAFVKVP